VDSEEFEVWLRELEGSRPFGSADRLGTVNLIDEAARRRGANSVELGQVFSLARPLRPDTSRFGAAASVELTTRLSDVPPGNRGETSGTDRFSVECHGLVNTHLDALNHFGVGGNFYGGHPFEDPQVATVSDYAGAGIFTRGVVADIPVARGTTWVADDEPVTGQDIDAALSGTRFEPGDALLLRMGRDAYEAAGNDYTVMTPGAPRPGLGPDGARWLVDHGVAALGWDFLDASDVDVPPFSVHRLIWATGLAVIDNCALGQVARACADAGTRTGALSIAPVATGGTGCVVNPLFVM
jgi:kynurenine formamidase